MRSNLGLKALAGSESSTPDEHNGTSACLDLENECSHARLRTVHTEMMPRMLTPLNCALPPIIILETSWRLKILKFLKGIRGGVVCSQWLFVLFASGGGGHRSCWRRARSLWRRGGGEVGGSRRVGECGQVRPESCLCAAAGSTNTGLHCEAVSRTHAQTHTRTHLRTLYNLGVWRAVAGAGGDVWHKYAAEKPLLVFPCR